MENYQVVRSLNSRDLPHLLLSQNYYPVLVNNFIKVNRPAIINRRRGEGIFWIGSKWLLTFLRVPFTQDTSIAQTIFSPCCPLNDRKNVSHSFFKIGHLFSPFSYLYLARLCLLILLLLLMSGNVHPNPGPIFSCSVCARNVTWRGRSIQCCTCSKWVQLRCLLLF